jgi:DNA repair protein RecN (Recombination protein N)
MITSLHIENFALIERLSIDFNPGFSTITGETGAGKSILLGALGLALGNRADLSSLKNKNEKCVIEATFAISEYGLAGFFASEDLDYDEQTIVRREILPSGKSRAFVNDSPVNLQQLQELGSRLIDIHSQHQTLSLSEAGFQFEIIDAIARNADLLSAYSDALSAYRQAQSRLSALRLAQQQARQQQDYHHFLLQELEEAALAPGQQTDLEQQQAELSHVEALRENLGHAATLAEDERFGIMRQLREFRSALQKISGVSQQYEELYGRASGLYIELDDLTGELQRHLSGLAADPAALEAINEKLHLIYSLQKKHHAGSVEELLAIRDGLAEKAGEAETLDREIEMCENEIAGLEARLDASAKEIHAKRIDAIPALTAKLAAILRELGMPDVQFRIAVDAAQTYFQNGKDELTFLFSANKGGAFGPLKKVASGGELSRTMLSVKAVLSEYSRLPTIIFDEIDTGVSGEIAGRMADIMKRMGATMQVLSITHLPQIAAKGAAHYKVFKTVSGDTTVSELKLLSAEERIAEIAQMLSGSDAPESAVVHAKALLN